ncbi:MAG: hypothetical protein K2W95_15195 [Candidatus Obscuribacterales bacterium]|nr:hypothetical protein [Candidatus Obscuribacterales bacterium]
MSNPRMSMVRTCIERAIGCLQGDTVRSTRVELAAPNLGFALQLSFALKAQTFTATLGTVAGVGPVDSYESADPAKLLDIVYGEVDAALAHADLSGLTAILSAQPVDPAQFLPVAKMVDSAPGEVRCMSEEMICFLTAAIQQTVTSARVRGTCSLRVTAPGKTWPVWICVDVADDESNFTASTNDVDLMVPCPPSFFSTQTSASAIVAQIMRFLAEEFIDAADTSVLIRREGNLPCLTGDSARGPGSIIEEVIADV